MSLSLFALRILMQYSYWPQLLPIPFIPSLPPFLLFLLTSVSILPPLPLSFCILPSFRFDLLPSFRFFLFPFFFFFSLSVARTFISVRFPFPFRSLVSFFLLLPFLTLPFVLFYLLPSFFFPPFLLLPRFLLLLLLFFYFLLFILLLPFSSSSPFSSSPFTASFSSSRSPM